MQLGRNDMCNFLLFTSPTVTEKLNFVINLTAFVFIFGGSDVDSISSQQDFKVRISHSYSGNKDIS